MNNLPLVLAIAVAVIDWFAVYQGNKKIEYFAKPGFMILLMIWVFINSPGNSTSIWLLLGLFFSLGGDIFLMLPKETFLQGLISFLIAHIFFIITFLHISQEPKYTHLTLLLGLLIFAFALFVDIRISKELIKSSKKKLVIPVNIYSLILFSMAFIAYGTIGSQNVVTTLGIIISIGATLFMLSDILLAWNKFVSPLLGGRFTTIIIYHIAQVLITTGVLLQIQL